MCDLFVEKGFELPEFPVPSYVNGDERTELVDDGSMMKLFDVGCTKVINVGVSAAKEATFIWTLAQRVRNADKTKAHQLGVAKGPKDSRPKVKTRSTKKNMRLVTYPTKPTRPKDY